jgi:hypothetical protein
MYQIADPDPRLSSLLLPTLVLHLDGCNGSIPAALSPSLHFFCVVAVKFSGLMVNIIRFRMPIYWARSSNIFIPAIIQELSHFPSVSDQGCCMRPAAFIRLVW